MGTLRLGVIWGLIGLSFLAGAAAASPALDWANVEYRLGSDFVGLATGTCEAPALFLAPGGGRLAFESQGGRWIEDVVDFDYAIADPGGPNQQYHPLPSSVERSDDPVPPGTGEIAWGPKATGHLYAAPGPIGPDLGRLQAGFSTARFATTGLVDHVAATTTFEEEPLTGQAVYVFADVEGPMRWVDLSNGTLQVGGDLVLYLEDATARFAAGDEFDVPARWENVSSTGASGVAEVRERLVHYAWLRLEGARVNVDAGARLLCDGFSGALAGTLNLYQARGAAGVEDQQVTIERNELTLEGEFEWTEAADGDAMRGSGSGRFDAVGVDFAPAAVREAVPGELSLQEIGFWASLVATAGAALYYGGRFAIPLFSRLTQSDVLDHPSRKFLLEAIRARPNINLHELTKLAGITKSEVRYHTRVLEAHGHVRSRRLHQERLFVAKDTIREVGRGILAATPELITRNDPVVGAIMQRIPREGGTRLNPLLVEVAAVEGISRPGAWKGVLRAERYGFLSREKQGREVWVRCADS